MADKPICSIPECGKASEARGLCQKHYFRQRRKGHTDRDRTDPETLVRFARDALGHNGEECLLWPYGKSTGYGVLTDPETGRPVGAHHFVCSLAHGEPTQGKGFARHACHNPACVNPRHLNWGTPKDNSQDSVRDGRFPRGAETGKAKLTEDDVREIRISSESDRTLGRRYGVNGKTVYDARRGHTWRHIEAPECRGTRCAPRS